MDRAKDLFCFSPRTLSSIRQAGYPCGMKNLWLAGLLLCVSAPAIAALTNMPPDYKLEDFSQSYEGVKGRIIDVLERGELKSLQIPDGKTMNCYVLIERISADIAIIQNIEKYETGNGTYQYEYRIDAIPMNSPTQMPVEQISVWVKAN